jgi:hypothetical protein
MNQLCAQAEPLRDRIERYCDGALDAAETAALEQKLREDPAAMDYFVLYMELHSRIAWNIRAKDGISGQWTVDSGQRATSGEWRVASEAEYPESPVFNLQISKSPNLQTTALHTPLSTLHYWAFSYSVATIFLAVFLLGAWSYTFTHPDPNALAAKNSRRVTPSGGVANETPDFTFVGRVSGMVDCQWADDATATSPGAGVALNRRYALKSGLMEITYDSGAKVILQGPCEYTVESPRGGFLQVGKLVARVGAGDVGRGAGTSLPSPIGRGAGGEDSQPHSQSALTLALSQRERGLKTNPAPHAPRPSPLFAVRTPTALVTDLGTEFGVEVSDSGETASHVFQGRVVMKIEGVGDRGRGTGDEKSEIGNQKSEILLSAGQSARVEKNGGQSPRIICDEKLSVTADNGTFVRRLPLEPARVYSQAVLADKPLFYWSFNETTGPAIERIRQMPNQALLTWDGATRCSHVSIGSGLALGNAADFTGETGFFATAMLRQTTLNGPWAIEFWAQFTSPQKNQYVINAGGSMQHPTNSPGVIFNWNEHATENELQFYSDQGGRTAAKEVIGLNKWHHVMLVYFAGRQAGGMEDRAAMLIDGQWQWLSNQGFAAVFDLEQALLVGAAMNDGREPMRGRLDELAIYDLSKFDARELETRLIEMARRHITIARNVPADAKQNSAESASAK